MKDQIKAHAKQVIEDVSSLVADGVHLRRQRIQSLIVANLTDEDYERFMAARIGYSGATGKGMADGPDGIGPYIATYADKILDIAAALDWPDVRLEFRDRQIIMRRSH